MYRLLGVSQFKDQDSSLNDTGGAKIGEGIFSRSVNNVEIKIDPKQTNKAS